jgi:hypothetical protein
MDVESVNKDNELSVKQHFYAVKTRSGKYFAGFNTETNSPNLVDDIKSAKLFSNKFDIKLRPGEYIVDIGVVLTDSNISVSKPFRPRKKTVKNTSNK